MTDTSEAQGQALAPPPGSRREWARAPEYDRGDAACWRHFWTGSLEWWLPGCQRDQRDNPLLRPATTKDSHAN